ncbi:hypothetical protein BD324DRAFT_651707 [Kockovaella imperatae]|uniref:RING-type domain-containing protein n=1 Tax=Kockovaella imperatae TaxID=4999 RepID=A0A1Y1UEL4_9TREE|nr:hypothetical protein BD324DRAFT_651707 [Kockovaella imperatae]ORX36468.1 hypothetical protein BD324DRAFT_651707 [Kockovaella imperatae]
MLAKTLSAPGLPAASSSRGPVKLPSWRTSALDGPSSPKPSLSRPGSWIGEAFELSSQPSGSYHSRTNEHEQDADDDDEIQFLEEAPAHLKRTTNKDNPIPIDDSDDEGDKKNSKTRAVETLSQSKRKRQPVSAAPMLDEDGWEIPNFPEDSPIPSDEAGPSTKRPRFEPLDPQEALLQLLKVIPDVDEAAALFHLTDLINTGRTHDCVQRTAAILLELEGGYPKAKKEKGKGKAVEESPELYRDQDYRRAERLGCGYFQLSERELVGSFAQIPVNHIRSTFKTQGQLLVPTYTALQGQMKLKEPPFVPLKRPRASYSNDLDLAPDHCMDNSNQTYAGAAEFYKERTCLFEIIARDKAQDLAAEMAKTAHDTALANGEGIECGCCFGEEVWDNMFQCDEGHLFCRDCAKMHAETKLGEQKTVIDCMDGSGCKALFPDSELKRLLPVKLLELYHRLKQAAELAQASIDGLESCPGCDYAAIIENPQEKLFKCENEACMQISCRQCKRPDHIPRTCEELDNDQKLDKRHSVEEAMSEALIRKCPRCSKPFLKEYGCNKIHCTGCNTLSCYVCRQVIKGYDHFDQNPDVPGQARNGTKCLLHDPEEHQKDAQTVLAARDLAQKNVKEAAKAQGLDLDDADLHVDAPGHPYLLYGVAQYNPPAHHYGIQPRHQPGAIGVVGAAGRPEADLAARFADNDQLLAGPARQLVDGRQHEALGAQPGLIPAVRAGLAHYPAPVGPRPAPNALGGALGPYW